MKIILFALFSLILLNCSSENLDNELKYYDLRGNVKSLHELHYSAITLSDAIRKGARISNESLSDFWLIDRKIVFNSFGYPVKIYFYNSDDTVFHSATFTHNKAGATVSRSSKSENDTIGYYAALKRNDSNELINEILFEDNEVFMNHFYKYETNNMVESSYYTAPFEHYSGKTTYSFDASNNKVQEQRFGEKESLQLTINYKYDSDNFIKEKVITKPNDDSKTHSFLYKFDNKKNWIKRTLFVDAKPAVISERTIKYFD